MTSDNSTDYYETDAGYLQDELIKLDYLINLLILKGRRKDETKDSFRGLYVSEEEVNSLLKIVSPSFSHQDSEIQAMIHKIEDQEQKIRQKRRGCIERGINLNLCSLSRNLHLKRFEMDTLIICAAPDIDSKYERLCAYLQDDLTRKRPSIGLILDLLCSLTEEKLTARKFFLPQGTLFREHLIEVEDKGQGGERLSTILRLNENLLSYILGLTPADFTASNKKDPSKSEIIFPEDLKRRIQNLVAHFKEKKGKRICRLHGPYGVGKEEVAENICSELRVDMVKLDLLDLALDRENHQTFVDNAFQNASLRGAALYLDHFEILFSEKFEINNLKDSILKKLNSFLGIVLISSEDGLDLDQKDTLCINLELPDYKTRSRIWKQYLDGVFREEVAYGLAKEPNKSADKIKEFGDISEKQALKKIQRDSLIEKIMQDWKNEMDDLCDTESLSIPAKGASLKTSESVSYEMHEVDRKEYWHEVAEDLANKFKFTPGQIRDAFDTACNLAILDGREIPNVTDLHEGCRLRSNRKLSYLAKLITPRYSWNDIVLPPDKLQQLKEIANFVKHKSAVYQGWGFGDNLSLGKGLNVLFSGSSGTGKTMAAEVLAFELNLELYKIDLSTVVSKYIGETEKNLNRIFQEAEQSNAMIFFDEADALFGKRSEVKDAHDRYANVEISYLLQKMEEHDGIVILATNLQENMDNAFMRRINFIVEIPFPDEECRLKIWNSLIPKNAPLADDIDFKFLARKFKIAGGNIKNVIVNAAFLAVGNSGTISMEHIIRAAKREFQKMDRVCTESDFGKYYELIKD